MKFNRQDLVEMAYDDYDSDVWTVITSEIIDTTRWSVVYEDVFEFCGKFYRTNYNLPSTEMQDEEPYEYDGDEIECEEVEPYTVEVTKYKTKENV